MRPTVIPGWVLVWGGGGKEIGVGTCEDGYDGFVDGLDFLLLKNITGEQGGDEQAE